MKAKSKGNVAKKLAAELLEILSKNKSLIESCDENQTTDLNKFLENFSEKLNSKNKEMAKYRLAWSTLVANIAIALTGIGAIAIVGKLIYSKTKNNRALFFRQKEKTTTEKKMLNTKDAFNDLSNILQRQDSSKKK